MNTEKIEQLLKKFENGQTSLEEEAELKDYFRSDRVPEHLASYQALFRYYDEVKEVKSSTDIDPFAKVDFVESAPSADQTPAGALRTVNSPIQWTLRIAAGLILLLIGFSAGLLVRQGEPVTETQVAALQEEIQQMKSALIYGSYQQASASERISAVNMSARIPGGTNVLDREISEILIYTMNNDNNINVRQAAAEALFRFRDEPGIRKALVNSLGQQSDPLMQITLIDMLVKLKEKTAINEMQKLLMDTGTRDVVKTRLQDGIAELNT